MQKQKKASIKLSLHQEIDREVRELEREIAQHPELEEIQVTEEMDRTLLEKIRACEREEERKRAEEKSGEDFFGLRDDAAEDEKVGDPERQDGKKETGRVRNFRSTEDNVELSDELTPDLSRNVVEDNVRSRMNLGDGAEKKVIYRRKKRKYWIFSLAAVLVIVLGVGVNSVGSKSYWKNLWQAVRGEPVNGIDVEDMEKQNTEDVDEIAAYREIKEKLKIEPVKLIYKPDDMKLVDYKIYEETLIARLLYKYQDEVVKYFLYVSDVDSSWGEKEEDVKLNEYTIFVNDIEMKVEEFCVDDNLENRLVAHFEYRGTHYQLKGIMKREEFEKILENLYFF